MSDKDSWDAMDVAATLLSRDADRAAVSPGGDGLGVEASPGFHPGQGRYVVDPDYMEILGLDSFDQLIKYHK